MSVPEKRIAIQGVAQSFEVLAQQLLAYENMPQVTRYQITTTRAGEGCRVEFGASLFLHPQVLTVAQP